MSVREEALKYGLSTLHAWIKFMECLLHISYKLGWKKTSTRGASSEAKDDMKKKTTEVRTNLWRELGIKVDKVVQGMGTSNTGNVARRFFENPRKTAEATGIDERLIHRFRIILSVLASGRKINFQKFDCYAIRTAELYVELYPWYRMPPSVHKILIHGSQAIKFIMLPIGQLSEEAQEARNKDVRYIREHRTRKMSSILVTTDLMHNLLASSDPLVAASISERKTSKRVLSKEALELLEIGEDEEDSDESEDRDEEPEDVEDLPATQGF